MSKIPSKPTSTPKPAAPKRTTSTPTRTTSTRSTSSQPPTGNKFSTTAKPKAPTAPAAPKKGIVRTPDSTKGQAPTKPADATIGKAPAAPTAKPGQANNPTLQNLPPDTQLHAPGINSPVLNQGAQSATTAQEGQAANQAPNAQAPQAAQAPAPIAGAGAQGPQGAQGAQGAQGPQGAEPTPTLTDVQRQQVQQMDSQLKKWEGQDVSEWSKYAYRDVAAFFEGEKRDIFISRLMDLPNTSETGELKARWLDLTGKFINSHREHPSIWRLSNAGVGIYNSAHLGPVREGMSKVLASDPRNIIDYFDNAGVDSNGSTKFTPMMKAMLDRSDGTIGPERARNKVINRNIASAVSQLASPVLQNRELPDTPANREKTVKDAHLLGYMLGGTQAGYEHAFQEGAARNREQADMMKNIVGLAAAPVEFGGPAGKAALHVVNGLLDKGIDSSFDRSTTNAFNHATSNINDLQTFYRRMINADENYALDQMILPKFNHVLLQSRDIRW